MKDEIQKHGKVHSEQNPPLTWIATSDPGRQGTASGRQIREDQRPSRPYRRVQPLHEGIRPATCVRHWNQGSLDITGDSSHRIHQPVCQPAMGQDYTPNQGGAFFRSHRIGLG